MDVTLHPEKRAGWRSILGGSDALLALGILGILIVILVPLPPALLDLLLIANLAASFVILMTAASAARPLDFSSFPSVLLVMTFFRLALNVASTRLVLGNAGVAGLAAAGNVIEAFARFVAGRNLAAGFVVFVIIVVVQFVLITKGTTRISEVAARFTLDAMPGRQLSIDGDLAAGFIDEVEARRQRQEIVDSTSFFGAMDGASKFVRGEAVAGLFITLTNILGGFVLGTLYYAMDLEQAASLFTRLTLGDGLVTQIPALMVSVATALLVARGDTGEPLARQISRQVLRNERVFFGASLFFLLLLPSGLPKSSLLLAGIACGATGVYLRLRRPATLETVAEDRRASSSDPAAESHEERARSLLVLEPVELEIGFRLIRLVDESRGGDLMTRLTRVRDKLALDLGFVMPAVKVLDNTRLHPAEYSIKLRGNGVGRWRVKPDRYLVTSESGIPEGLTGSPGADPITGAPGLWIEESQCPAAASVGLRLRKVSEIVADHLDRVVRIHAAEMLTREEASRLVSDLRRRAPALVDELIPGTLKLGEVHKVLQALLREQVSVRDLETILETLADYGDRTRDARELAERARRALSRSISSGVAGRDGHIRAALLDPALEEFLQGSLEKAERGWSLAIEPEISEALSDSIAAAAARLDASRLAPVLVCSAALRVHLRELTCSRLPLLSVLAYEEIASDLRLEEQGTVALDKDVIGIGRIEGGVRNRK